MFRWLLFGIVLLANIVAVISVLAPTLTNFAEVVPNGIESASCESADIVQALIRAASAGRAQVIDLVLSCSWLYIAIAILNVSAIIAALFLPILTRR